MVVKKKRNPVEPKWLTVFLIFCNIDVLKIASMKIIGTVIFLAIAACFQVASLWLYRNAGVRAQLPVRTA